MITWTSNGVLIQKIAPLSNVFLSGGQSGILRFPIILFLLFGCRQSDSEELFESGFLEGDTYTCEEIGWTIQLPRDWEMDLLSDQQASTDRGVEQVEASTEYTIDYSGLVHLFSIRADQFNIMQASMESADFRSRQDWEQNLNLIEEVVSAAFNKAEMDFKISRFRAQVDGLDFDAMQINHYLNGEHIFSQTTLNRYINGYIFSVVLTYNSEELKAEMIHSVQTSKFTMRKSLDK